MQRMRQILSIVTLLILFSALAEAQNGLLRGIVVDAEQNPIAGVRVTVTSEQMGSYRKQLTTTDKGEFKLRFQANQAQYVFQFLFEKAGFQSFTQPLSPTMTRAMREKYVMDPAQSQVVESHGDLSAVITGSSSAAIDAFNKGLAAQRAGDLAAARVSLEEALAADPSLTSAYIALAQVLFDENDYSEALAAADSALEFVPGGVDALRVRYQALRALGQGKEAGGVALQLEAAEGAVAAARLLYNEGGEAFQAGDRETALVKFRRAAELDPTLMDAHHAIATLELAQGNHGASAAAAEKALGLGSEDVRTLRVLYDAYDALGRTDELLDIAPRLAAVDPEFGGAKLIEQASEMWNAGQAERAVSLSRLALVIDPSLAKAYYFLGLDQLSKGNNEEARTALEKFISLAPDDAEAPTAREMLTFIE